MLAARIPHSRLAVFAHSGHAFKQDQPNRAVRQGAVLLTPTLGPASVAVTPGVTDLLERLSHGTVMGARLSRPGILSDIGGDEQAVLAQLQEFRILLPTT